VRIDLIRPDAWDLLCDQYRLALPFQDPALCVQIYAGYQHALWECTQALAKIFPHKKTVVLVEQGEPSFEAIAMMFSADGYQVHSIKEADFHQPGNWPGGGLAALQPELLCVIHADDDPVTGRVHRYPQLQSALKAARVFSIAISHALFRFETLSPPHPFEVRILSLAPERALLLGGARCKIRPPLVAQMPWAFQEADALRSELQPVSENEMQAAQRAITAFEAGLPAGFKAFFGPALRPVGAENALERVWDRAVIYHLEYDGFAIIQELHDSSRLAATQSSPLPTPGANAEFETMSPCRWESERLSEWLGNRGENEDQVRGLIMIDARKLSGDLKKKLQDVAEKIRLIQG
jgi:hypothetical protein